MDLFCPGVNLCGGPARPVRAITNHSYVREATKRWTSPKTPRFPSSRQFMDASQACALKSCLGCALHPHWSKSRSGQRAALQRITLSAGVLHSARPPSLLDRADATAVVPRASTLQASGSYEVDEGTTFWESVFRCATRSDPHLIFK
jgi:hypothetical protein